MSAKGPFSDFDVETSYGTARRRTDAVFVVPTGFFLRLTAAGNPDAITSRLLLSAADVLEGNGALDVLFRQQLMELLATRLVVAHAGSQMNIPPSRAV